MRGRPADGFFARLAISVAIATRVIGDFAGYRIVTAALSSFFNSLGNDYAHADSYHYYCCLTENNDCPGRNGGSNLPSGVRVAEWILTCVAIGPWSAPEPNRITLDIPPKRRIEVAEVVVVEISFLVEILPR